MKTKFYFAIFLLVIANLIKPKNSSAQCTINAGTNIAVCQNGSLQLNAISTGNPIVLWTSTPAGGIISGGNTLTPTINTSLAIQYSLVISGNSGQCTSNTIVVTVNVLPNTPVITVSPSTMQCAGTSLNFSTPTQAGITFSWNFGDGTPAGTGSSVSHIYYPPSGNGTVNNTVTITATNTSTGCIQNASQTIAVKQLPNTPIITITNNNSCAGTSIGFSTPSQGGVTFSWNFGDGTSGAGSSVSHKYSPSNGNSSIPYQVTVTATNSNNCSSTATQTVNVNPLPDASITNYASKPFTNCGGGAIFNLVVDNTSTTKSTNSIYIINWGDFTPNYNSSIPPTSLSHQYNGLGYFTLTLTVTGQNGCISTKIYSVFNGSNPAVSFGNPGSTVELCIPYTLSFPISGTGNNPPGTIYVITKNDGTSNDTLYNPPPSNYTHIFTYTSCGAIGGIQPNTFFVRIKAQNPCGNSTATIEPITTNQVPVANFTRSPDTIVCVNTTVTFSNTSQDGATVDNNGVCDTTTANNWSISPSTGWTLVSGTILGTNPLNPYNPTTWGSQNLKVQFNIPGIYHVLLRVQGTNTCGYDSIVKNVCIQSPPTPSFTAIPMNGCSPLVVNFNNTSAGLNQCATITKIWNVAKTGSTCIADSTNNFVFISGTNASSLNPIIRFNNQGTYAVTLSLTNICGTFTKTDTITVKRKPQVTITVPTNICLGQTISPTTNTLLPCGDVISIYSWTFSGGSPSTSNQQNPGVISYATAGPKNITLAVTNGCGTTTVSSTLNVLPPPIANAGIDKQICSGGSAALGAVPISGLTYQWTPSSGLSSTIVANPNITLSNTGSTPITNTYILTVTNAALCTTNDTVLVTVNPLPNVTVTPSASICIGNSTSLNAYGADTYSWSPSAGLSITTGSTVTAHPTSTTTYTVTGTSTSTGCVKTAIVTVTVNQLPIVSAGTAQTLCNQPIPATLTGTPAGGTWSGTNITSGGVFTPNGTGTFTVLYTYTNTNGCTNKDSAIISVINPANVHAGSDSTVCLNSNNVQLNGTPSGGIWNGSTLVSPTGLFTPSQAGTFNLIYSNGTGTCLRKDTMVMTVKPLPNVTVTASTSICIGNSTILIASGADTYNWSPSTGLSTTTGSTVTANPVLTTTYTVTGTSTSTGCVKTATITVTVNPLPIVAFSNPTIACINIPILFSNATTGASNYVWSFGDGTILSGISPSHTYTLSGNFTIKLIAYSAFGCIDSTTRNIQIIEPPVANFTVFPNIGCAPLLVVFTNNSTGANTSFLWNFGNGISSVLFSPPNQLYQQGLHDTTYFVSLTVTNQCGVSTFNDSVNIKPIPVAIFGTNVNSGCSPLAVFVNNSSTGNASQFTWNFGDGSAPVIGLNPGEHIYTTGTNDTTYILTMIGINSCGSDTVIKPILVHPDLVTAFFNTNAVSGCAPHSVTFTNFSTGGTFMSWDFGDGNVSTSLNPTHIYQNSGTYICYQFVNNGCSYDTASVIITVYPQPALSFSSDVSTLCANQPVTFLNSSINTGNFAWSFGDGTLSNISNPSHIYLNSGTYTITLVGTSITYGCIDSVKHSVIVNAIPHLQITSNVAYGCEPLTITFNNNSQNAIFYSWNFGDGNTSALEAPTHLYDNIGIYTINVFAQNLEGCSDSTQLQINVYPRPSAAFTMYSNTQCPPVEVNLTNSSSGAIQYFWDFGNGNNANTVDASVTYYTDNQYPISLVAANTFGCKDTATNSFMVYCDGLFVPNALMPLDQTTDARWFLPKGKSLKSYRLQIFNTWGTLLFETTALDANGSPTEGWDGRFNGLPCMQDVYVWKIDAIFLSGRIWPGKEYPDGKVKKTGTVTLIQ